MGSTCTLRKQYHPDLVRPISQEEALACKKPHGDRLFLWIHGSNYSIFPMNFGYGTATSALVANCGSAICAESTSVDSRQDGETSGYGDTYIRPRGQRGSTSMQKITIMPSSHYWTENGHWYAHITIYTGKRQIQVQREFETEPQANWWRATMMELLRDASLEVR